MILISFLTQHGRDTAHRARIICKEREQKLQKGKHGNANPRNMGKSQIMLAHAVQRGGFNLSFNVSARNIKKKQTEGNKNKKRGM